MNNPADWPRRTWDRMKRMAWSTKAIIAQVMGAA
jgi:hypothetical protein